MKRVFVLLALSGILLGCSKSCPEGISEETKNTISLFQDVVKTRHINGKITAERYAEVSIEDALAFELWVAETKALVAMDEAGALAKRFRYPFQAHKFDKTGNRTMSKPVIEMLEIKDEQEFCKYYKNIMNAPFKQLIVSQNLDSLLLNKDGRVLFEKGYFQVSRKKDSFPEDYEVVFIFN